MINRAGERVDVRWRWGFSVQFTPHVEIVARDGSIVGRHDHWIALGGSYGPDGLFGACEVGGRVWSGTEISPPRRS